MAWITTTTTQDDDGHDAARSREQRTTSAGADGVGAELRGALGLCPEARGATEELGRAVLGSEGGLTLAERAMIAAVVSAHNGCEHGTSQHARDLRAHWAEARVDRLLENWTELELSPREWATVSYAVTLTGAPDEVDAAMVEELREAGLSDREVLEVALVTGYVNFTNRLALGLGVQRGLGLDVQRG